MDADNQVQSINVETPSTRRLVDAPKLSSLPFLAIRDEYIALCEGRLCAAAILAAFETWTTGKLDRLHRDAEGRPNWTREDALKADIWVYKAQAELARDLKGLFGKRKVINDLDYVRKRGFIAARFNPTNPGDRVLHYRFEAAAVQAAISKLDVPPQADRQDEHSTMSEPTEDYVNSDIVPTQNRHSTMSNLHSGYVNSDIVPTQNRHSTMSEPDGYYVENAALPENPSKTPNKNDSENPVVEVVQESRAPAREEPAAAAAQASETDIQRIVSIYEANIGPITPLLRDEMLDALMEFEPRWIIHAMTEAVEANALNWRYVRTVCERIKADGGDLKGRKSKNGSGRKAPPAESPSDQPDAFKASAEAHNDYAVAVAEGEVRPEALDYDPDVPEMPPSPHVPGKALDAWGSVYWQLERQYDKPTFDRLLRDSYLVNVEAHPAGDMFVVAVRSEQACNEIRPQTCTAICRLLTPLYGHQVQIRFVVGRPPAGPDPRPLAQALSKVRWMQRVERAEPSGVGK